MTSAAPFDAILKLFDSYSRVARLYPSLIALAPIVWSAIALFPSIIDTASHSAAFVIAAACILYFLTSLARSLGKRAEIRLLKRWQGWPTTILLRHRDSVLDKITKDRYHRALEKVSGLVLPTIAQEQQDPRGADDLYRSAAKKLIEQRRGPEFALLHGENASYGFRRNLYGLKPVALVETVIIILLTGFGWWLITPQPYTRLIVAQSVISYPHFLVLLGLDFSFVLLWLWAVSPDFVFQSGREYGEALLRTLDA
jgi:hypothetical protein